ncbi:MAG: hypothetical protein JWM27_106 [Gemmatimonadetes bacterium]|nr:hypothetical protein [Gemmatimonadota bacterium]
MHRRHILPFVLLASAMACQDAPLTPSGPAEPRFAIATAGPVTTDLRSGYDYVCALRSGRVACFGAHDEGQPNGVYSAATGSFVQLSAGPTHACALTTAGAVQCMGANDFGKAPPLRRTATGSYVAVSAGLSHSCAVRKDGVVECWGSSTYGQAPPVFAPQTGKFTEVTASATTTCALRNDGVIECRGRRQFAPAVQRASSGTYVMLAPAIGQTNCALTSTGVVDCWGYLPGRHTGPYVQVTVGASHRCALRADGGAECPVGYPGSWQGPEERSLTTGRWTRITAGNYHTCGLRADGYFECFGEVQTIGSDAPDVIPVADVPRSTLPSAARIRLEWRDRNANELRGEIERSVADRDRNPTSWMLIAKVRPDSRTYSDSVAAGATYVYRLRMCNNAGCSQWQQSNPTAAPATVPPAPSRVAASSYTCGYASCAKVTWTVDNTFVEELRLQRRVNTGAGYGAWEDLPAQGRLTTTFDQFGLKAGASYQYRVQACNSRGCSVYVSSNAFVARPPPPPAAPASLTANAMGNYMYLVWGDVANETTYERQRREKHGTAFGEWSAPIVRTMNVTSDQDPITPSTVYQYRIRACNDGGCSAYTSSAPTQA